MGNVLSRINVFTISRVILSHCQLNQLSFPCTKKTITHWETVKLLNCYGCYFLSYLITQTALEKNTVNTYSSAARLGCVSLVLLQPLTLVTSLYTFTVELDDCIWLLCNPCLTNLENHIKKSKFHLSVSVC